MSKAAVRTARQELRKGLAVIPVQELKVRRSREPSRAKAAGEGAAGAPNAAVPRRRVRVTEIEEEATPAQEAPPADEAPLRPRPAEARRSRVSEIEEVEEDGAGAGAAGAGSAVKEAEALEAYEPYSVDASKKGRKAWRRHTAREGSGPGRACGAGCEGPQRCSEVGGQSQGCPRPLEPSPGRTLVLSGYECPHAAAKRTKGGAAEK